MSDSTVKPTLPRKRDKRSVENTDFAAFTRRILRAYSRRIAAGDVEALRSLVTLASDVDALTKEAVAGLREFGYSWTEIASRVGVTRQAAQQRWGNPADRFAVDSRIRDAGLLVTVPVLVTVFIEHHRVAGISSCPGCGYVYPDPVGDCPTNMVVRPLLRSRRREHPHALSRLTGDQLEDLVRVPDRRPQRPYSTRNGSPMPGLFDPAPSSSPTGGNR